MQVRQIVSLTAGAALAGGITAVPVTPSSSTTHIPAIQLTSSGAQDIVIDVVRHAQMISPYENLLTPSPAFPGAPLSDLGLQQAQDVGQKLFDELGPVAGIFAGEGLREMQTAAPFAALEHMSDNVPILPGLDEIDSGVYALDPIESLGGRLAFLTVGAWSLGAPFGLAMIPVLASHDANGVLFNEHFTGAINTIYDTAMANPVVSDNGQITEVAFNSEASIFAWAMMNVKNPDLPFFLNLIAQSHQVANGLSTVLLPNTGIVQIEGNPTDGWTLVSWDGRAIPQDPDLLSALFVDARDLVLPSQTAMWNIYEAVLGGDQTTIMNAVQTGFEQIGAALTQFPGAVLHSLADALGASGDSGGAFGDLLAVF
ncbi:phosphoglycerate mutase family protein [[Mycobacterium] nativiensis]|uniref:Histidine phosphatase family protein n=1 Tax=[Mycobacterium] nativiensis TaxID=2855503 RepID=A0ABU5XS15_9MYCO|nr:histidine phosphatase family protein [Mycolicibacter sp. MYC340]MEB3030537.1 histidine phosphatase family protein [Mycolicibacter sp. MYC340]